MEPADTSPTQQPATRVIVADDHPLMREALTSWLARQTGLEVVGEASHGPELVALCQTLRPELAVVDLDMPGMDGVQVTQQLKQACPGTRTVIYTGSDSSFDALRAYRAGAFAFVVKTSAMTAFEHAIRRASLGEKYFPDEMLDDLGSRAADGAREPLDDLTDREREVFLLVAKGKTTREIAEMLDVTTRSITRHKSRIYEKLGASTDADLARVAVRMRIVDG